MHTTRPVRTPRLGRVAPLACGCALASAAVLVAVYDPSTHPGVFPACAFHQMTGLWCPGCGLTRATHHLLRGDIGGALGSNAFTPLVLVIMVLAWWTWVRRSFGRPADRLVVALRSLVDRSPGLWGAAAVTIVVAYDVLRNLPMAPFAALAP